MSARGWAPPRSEALSVSGKPKGERAAAACPAVHGIWNTGEHFEHLRKAVVAAGAPAVLAVDLEPNTGAGTLADLAAQVGAAAERLRERCGDGAGRASSALLPGARSSRRFPVLLHRWMLTDGRVVDSLLQILR